MLRHVGDDVVQAVDPDVLGQDDQLEDPLAMSLASLVMSRPGSVLDGERPGSALSIMSISSPTKTPVRSRKMRNAVSLNTIDSNSKGRENYIVLL